MFFRDTTSKNSKSPVLQLVENERTPKGPRQRIVASLGTYLRIPKDDRNEVARIVEERLLGQASLFDYDPRLIVYADKVVKKIQIEGKWNSCREQVSKFKQRANGQKTAEVFIDDVQHGYDRELGPVLIGHCFWRRLNFPTILNECGLNEKQIQTAEISLLNRLIAQDSEHSIIPWLQTVAIDDLLGLDTSQFGDDRFYRISDKILRNQEHIEQRLYERERDLFSLENSIFLYDLTNTYFEGICARNPKAEYNGNQKEKRTDCPQVVVALVLDGEGFVRRHRIFNGKMTDMNSLERILTGLEDDFKDKPMPTIIFDRGMVSEKNLELLNKYDNLKYIIMCRANEESLFLDDFRDEEFISLEERSSSKGKVEIFIKEVGDAVYILCKSEGRKAKESAMRNKVEEKLEAELTNLLKQIQNGRENNPVSIERRIGRLKERHSKVAKYYEIEYGHREFGYTIPSGVNIPKRLLNSLQKLKAKTDNNKISFPALQKKLEERKCRYPSEYSEVNIHLKEPVLTWRTIDEKESEERKLEGNYLLKTNRKDLKSGDKIWNLYIMLTRVEDAFRDLKSNLGLRPNYHQKENRVDGHIFISVLAYHLLHSIEHSLRQKGEHSRWARIKLAVSTHNYSTIQLPTVGGTVINVRRPGIPEGVHLDIYQKLGVDYQNLLTTKNLA